MSDQAWSMTNAGRATIRAWFIDHPHSIGEGYLAHARVAAGFGLAMLGGGLACLIHAIVPGLFSRTASRTIHRLHGRMTLRSDVEIADHDHSGGDRPLVYEI